VPITIDALIEEDYHPVSWPSVMPSEWTWKKVEGQHYGWLSTEVDATASIVTNHKHEFTVAVRFELDTEPIEGAWDFVEHLTTSVTVSISRCMKFKIPPVF
jgi:hypothetical protein